VSDSLDVRAANHSCFTCGYFGGLMGLRAACSNRRLSPIHDEPATGCKRWTSYNPAADREIRTVEDWHVHASKAVPGFSEVPAMAFRPALTGPQIHQAHDAHPSPATSAFAWELARGDDLLLRMYYALLEMAKGQMPLSARVHLRRLAQHLLDEPRVRAAIEREAMKDQIAHRGE
jgi:hypothetical protein